MTEFKVGDKVSWNGMVGVVEKVDTDRTFPVFVNFHDALGPFWFKLDGRYANAMTEPCLKLVEELKLEADAKPIGEFVSANEDGTITVNIYGKKKVKRFGYQVIYENQTHEIRVTSELFQSETAAKAFLHQVGWPQERRKFVALGPKIEWFEE